MIIGTKGATYGLQSKGNQKQQQKAKPSIFGGFDGEEDHTFDKNAAVRAQQGVKRSDAKVCSQLQAEGVLTRTVNAQSASKHQGLFLLQVKQMQAAALLEDANCFDYDSFFDEMQEKRNQEKVASYQREQAGPKYLASMMVARDQRQKMRDIIYEKQEALAAKADADIYGEKEQFATAAYKKKLQEDKLFAEQMAAKCAVYFPMVPVRVIVSCWSGWRLMVEHMCRDKADEGKTVESQGMEGFLGILQSAVARNPGAELAGEGQEDGAVQDTRDGTDAAAAKSFESMMEKKKRLKLEEKMATMDKYERRRFELEQGIAAVPPVRAQQSRQQPAEGRDAERLQDDDPKVGPSSSGHDSQRQAGARSDKAPVSAVKRTAEDKIAAARERAKQRRMK